jgi:hypothetical protein
MAGRMLKNRKMFKKMMNFGYLKVKEKIRDLLEKSTALLGVLSLG